MGVSTSSTTHWEGLGVNTTFIKEASGGHTLTKEKQQKLPGEASTSFSASSNAVNLPTAGGKPKSKSQSQRLVKVKVASSTVGGLKASQEDAAVSSWLDKKGIKRKTSIWEEMFQSAAVRSRAIKEQIDCDEKAAKRSKG